MNKIVFLLMLVITFSSCKPILRMIVKNKITDTEGETGILSTYNDDNIVFKTNTNFTYSTNWIKNNDAESYHFYSGM